MSFSKFVLLFVSVFFAFAIYADEASTIKDEAKGKADKIAEIQSQLKGVAAEAAAAKDQVWQGCVGKYLSDATQLAGGAGNLVAQIAAALAGGNISAAQKSMPTLDSMVTSAEKLLADAQNCERSSAKQQANSKVEMQRANVRGSVSSAMSLSSMTSDMPTETNRGAVEGSDAADAAGIDASGVIQTTNDGSAEAEVAVAPTETPEDATQIEEQVPVQEEQSPTM